MRMRSFCSRTAKEILRDPLNIIFGLGFPIVLLALLSAIQANIPVSLFEIQALAPAITVFALSFITLFSATLISKDRESALLSRLYTTPMTPLDFIVGYALPILPLAIAQCAVTFLFSFVLGLAPSVNILFALILEIPTAIFFISLGLICGSVLSVKQVGGLCGALLTNLSAWLSGIWFDLELVGGVFKKIAYLLPFVHAVELERAAAIGNFQETIPHLLWVISYALILSVIAVFTFLRQMKK